MIDDLSSLVGVGRQIPVPSSSEGYLGANPFVHPSVAARRDWFRENPYDQSILRSQDRDLWLTSAQNSSFLQLPCQLLYYRVPRELSGSSGSSDSSDSSVGYSRPGSTGLWPPRESITRAIRASGDLNPKPIRVISLIFVFIDSIRPLESPCSIDARIAARCLTLGGRPGYVP